MPLDHDTWRQVDNLINDRIKQSHGPFFSQGVVTRSDPTKNLVWLDEFGDQPIPLFTFDYDVKYYDTQPTGNVTSGQPVKTQLVVKKAVLTPKCPVVGDIVLVARQHGSRRLPKCLGVLRSRDFILPSDTSS